MYWPVWQDFEPSMGVYRSKVVAQMVTVACVLRSGGDYTIEYIERLREGIRKHLNYPHRFVCLTDISVPCENIRLVTEWPGWLAKLELFRPGLFNGLVLYLDLDTIVIGNIDKLVEYPHEFSMLTSLSKPKWVASGVMAWNGDYSHIFNRFNDELVPKYKQFAPYGGDGGWIGKQLEKPPTRIQDILPGQVVSYKKYGILPEARIVCFHGHPRPHKVNWGET